MHGETTKNTKYPKRGGKVNTAPWIRHSPIGDFSPRPRAKLKSGVFVGFVVKSLCMDTEVASSGSHECSAPLFGFRQCGVDQIRRGINDLEFLLRGRAPMER